VTSPAGQITPGALLNGRVRYDQFAHGYRTGIEPVILAAAVQARAGDQVLEAGSGAGAGLLCLSWRVPGVIGLGVEQDAALVALARANARANGWAESLTFHCAAIEAFRPGRMFDHAFANPPWHAAKATPSPDPARDRAKRAGAGLLRAWAGALTALVRPRGTVALILPAGLVDAAILALSESGCGSFRLVPLWPRAGVAAKRAVLIGRRGGRGAMALSAGLALHAPASGFTPAADHILRDGHALACEPEPPRRS
jgi:tRNA1(Val) A37 N6-methylase TrmN6